LSVHHRGTARIAAAYLTIVVSNQPLTVAESRSSSFSCHATLHNVAPGETRWVSCDLTVGIGDRQAISRVLDEIERLRAGDLSAHLHVEGELDASIRQVPDAEPLIAEEIRHLQQIKEDDKKMIARRNVLVPRLGLLLLLYSVFVAGGALPGLFGRSPSAPATLGLAFAGAAVAFAVGMVDATRTPGVRGWELIVAVFTSVEYGVPFVAGMLFGNLVYLRQRISAPIAPLQNK
jgi:hypothetical protein